MAIETETLLNYGDTNVVEDVSNLIEILTARENYFVSNLGKVTAIAKQHEYQTDNLASVGSLAVEEGATGTDAALTTPARLVNLIQTSAKFYRVSDQQRMTEKFSGTDELTRQTSKAIMELANSMEFDLIRATQISGASGTVPKLSGIIEASSKSTNHSSHSSGTVFAASILNAMLKDNWDNSNGDVATDYFVGSFLRDVVDGFTQKTNNIVSVPSDTIENQITFYATSFGFIKFHTHRYVQQSGDATGRVLGVRPEKLKVAYLMAPNVKPLAKTGLAERRVVSADFTLETRNQDSQMYHDGFDID